MGFILSVLSFPLSGWVDPPRYGVISVDLFTRLLTCFISGNVIIRLYILNRCTGSNLVLNGILVISTYLNKNSSNPIYTGSLLFIICIFCRSACLLSSVMSLYVFIWLICQNRSERHFLPFKLIPVIKENSDNPIILGSPLFMFYVIFLTQYWYFFLIDW